MNPLIEEAYQLACQARLNAHAPYSNFRVGAAVKAVGHDAIAAGCNVENGSYGATICAERNAVFQLVSQLGKIDLEFVVLVTDTEPAAMPCAMCRQVIEEFANDRTMVHVGNLSGVSRSVHFRELLPYPFDSTVLNSDD
jgi:cytidine deaminase